MQAHIDKDEVEARKCVQEAWQKNKKVVANEAGNGRHRQEEQRH